MGLSKGRGKLKQSGDEIVIGEDSATGSATLKKPAYTGGNDSEITLPDVQTDSLLSRTSIDTITNKSIDGDDNTITDVALSSLKTVLGDANKVIRRDASGVPVSDNAIPNSSALVTTDAAQTLTSKTIDADSNTLSNIENDNIKANAAIDAAKIADGSVSNTEFQYLGGVTSDLQTQLNNKIDSGNVDLTSDVTGSLPIANGGTGETSASAAFDALSPLTTEGDLLVGGVSGAGTRLAKGSEHEVPVATSTSVAYKKLTNDNIADNAAISLTKLEGGTIPGYVLVTDGSNVQEGGATAAEVAHLSGVSSNIQDQLDDKRNTIDAIAWGDVNKTGSNLTDIATRSHTSLSDVGTNSHANIDSHIASTSNPHSVTATHVGLGNVDNTSDATKNSASVSLTNKTIVEPVIDNFADFNEESAPGSPSAGKLRVYAKADKKLYKKDSDGLESEVGSGGAGGGRNYLSDWADATKDIGTVTNSLTDVVDTSDRTANKTTWGSSDTSKLTIARSSSSPLRQSYSYLITEAGSSAGAFVESPLFSLDAVDLGKPVTVSFDVSGNSTSDYYQVYVCRYDSDDVLKERILIAGTASATSPYSARIPTGTSNFQGFFIAGSTSTDQYSLRIVSNNNSADSIMIDSLYIGPQNVVQGAAITDWQSFTPVWSTGALNTTGLFSWRRNGSNMEIGFYYSQSSAGTQGSGSYILTLPNGSALDQNVTISGSGGGASILGGHILVSAGSSGGTFYNAKAQTSTQISFYTSGDAWGSSSSVNFGTSNLRFSGFVSIPIVGWSSNVTMANRAVEGYLSNTGTTATAGGNNSATTSYYGLDGVPFLSIASTTANSYTIFDITLPSPAQPTDSWKVEMKNQVSNAWIDAPTYLPQGTSKYGAFAEPTSATNLRVYFGNKGARPTNATYAGDGEAWSNYTTYRWRVRKVSGGASVGFPVSARNIVGDTSGTAVPSGFIGEFKENLVNTGTLSTSYANFTTISLTPGIWLLSGVFNSNSGLNSGDAVDIAMDAIGIAGKSTFQTISAGARTALYIPSQVVIVSSTTNYTLKARNQTAGRGSVIAYLNAVRIA